jgi:hypothetical protein
MKKLHVVCIAMLAISFVAQAQTEQKFNVGFGMGIDYGGFGGRLTYMPIKNFGLFGGLGYNLNSLGYNVGANWVLAPNKKVVPYLTGMYGYNAVMIVTGDLEKKTTYYGPSFGAGIQVPRGDRSFWNFELLVPLRPSAYNNDVDELKNMGAKVKEVYPVAISIGYHFRFPN